MRRLLTCCSLAATLLGFQTACSPKPDADDPTGGFFPMHVGASWKYELVSDMSDPLIAPEIIISVDRQIEFDAWPAWVRRHHGGVEYYLRRDKDGVRRVATRTEVQETAVLDEKPRFVLKLPLQVGTSWEASTVPYLLRRPNEYPRDLIHTHQAMQHHKIEALNQTVEVPAGQFSGCLVVKAEGSLRLFTDPNNGFNDVPLITQEWYCPNVGLVKFERSEEVPSGQQFMTGGKVSYVLTQYRQP